MRMALMVSGFVAFTLALSVAGCEDTTDPASPEITPEFAVMGVTQSATGSGHILRGPNETLRVFTFSAITLANGTTIGNWLVTQPGSDQRLQFAVECLVVKGNVAYVGGRRKGSNRPSYFQAVDNGDGPYDPPDQISLTTVSSDPNRLIEWCTNPWSLRLYDVARGNVLVRTR